jgi:hypothetical protein
MCPESLLRNAEERSREESVICFSPTKGSTEGASQCPNIGVLLNLLFRFLVKWRMGMLQSLKTKAVNQEATLWIVKSS